MNTSDRWVRAFIQQADADFRAWELYEKHPEALAAECHKLLFLQMACEKLCKAHLIREGSPVQSSQKSHKVIVGSLPVILRNQIEFTGSSLKRKQTLIKHIRHLALEIELLNPSIKRDGRRPDNCEYP